MGYCEVADVKVVVQIESSDNTYDVELAAAVVSADALVDSLLKPYDLSVPATVPQNVVDASSHFAAWVFRRKRDPVGAEAFWVEANRFLEAYIDAESESAFLVGGA